MKSLVAMLKGRKALDLPKKKKSAENCYYLIFLEAPGKAPCIAFIFI
jgi:hypothetical protein